MTAKRTTLSVAGLAAAIAILIMFLLPTGSERQAQAAMIIQKLNEQIEQNPLLEVTLDSLRLEGVFIDGRLQITAQAVVGDLAIEVDESVCEQHVSIDLALALGPKSNWILIRKLDVSDPEIQAMLPLMFPPGSETLLMLPEDLKPQMGLDLAAQLGEARQEFSRLTETLLESKDDLGGTLQEQPDGTLLLTLPIKDANALANVAKLLSSEGAPPEAIRIIDLPAPKLSKQPGDAGDPDANQELIGATLAIVYDPRTQQVCSFAIRDLGIGEGSVSVSLGAGEVDPQLLDPERVTTSATRVIDLEALQSLGQPAGEP